MESKETGQIDWESKNPGPCLVMGDMPADYMSECIGKIVEEYQRAMGRKPCREELEACFNFCVNPMDELPSVKKILSDQKRQMKKEKKNVE